MSAASVNPAAETPIPLARLVRIELRKAVNTRSGFWLAVVVAGLCALLLVLGAFGAFKEMSAQDMLEIGLFPVAFLLPFVGLLLISAEFTTRTALTTFVLVPSRGRVVAAKLLAVILIGLVATLILAAASWLASLPAPNPDEPELYGYGEMVWRAGLDLVTGVAGGFAFGLLIRNTPAAIVAYIFVPMLVGTLTVIPAIQDAGPWLTASASPFGREGGDLSTWAQVWTTTAIFTVAPVLGGLLRLRRSEIS